MTVCADGCGAWASPEFAYVLGVMLGDGCCWRAPKTWRLELKVTDETFALAFAAALDATLRDPRFGPTLVMTQTRSGRTKLTYRVTVASKPFGDWWQVARHDLDRLRPVVMARPASFLRGLYDSEGSLGRVARIVSNRSDTLHLAKEALSRLGLDGVVKVARPAGTMVTVPGVGRLASGSDLWMLTPRPTVDFLSKVGSSIARKAGWPESAECFCGASFPIRPGRRQQTCSPGCTARRRVARARVA